MDYHDMKSIIRGFAHAWSLHTFLLKDKIQSKHPLTYKVLHNVNKNIQHTEEMIEYEVVYENVYQKIKTVGKSKICGI